MQIVKPPKYKDVFWSGAIKKANTFIGIQNLYIIIIIQY